MTDVSAGMSVGSFFLLVQFWWENLTTVSGIITQVEVLDSVKCIK